MNSFSSGDAMGLLVVAVVLLLLGFMLIRAIGRSSADLETLRKRCLMWTQIGFGLTLLQIVLRGDWRFGSVLLLITLFTGSLWYAARHYENRRPPSP
ncbi:MULTISPECIES: hypothetical protein [Paenibacillus]|uniref:hypothetical protein n=1 Tax=Paenibacillus TaxID=44249 RepID=UPI0022B86919|nr:hypothetical protein [Paenibacillus caseinilyticus]MCZ8522084.1 hypothetical protein [Paenibacillus caseinilyticus]